MGSSKYIEWYNKWSGKPDAYEESFAKRVVDGLRNNEPVFLDDGTLNKEWSEAE